MVENARPSKNDDYRREIVRQYHDGKSVQEIIQWHGIPRSTFYRWLKRYKEPALERDMLQSGKIRELMDTIAGLEEENRLLRLAIHLIARH